MVKEVMGGRSRGSCGPGMTLVFTLGEMEAIRDSKQRSKMV